MPKVVITAAVKDVQAWLEFKPLLIAQLSGVASDGTSYVATDGTNTNRGARRSPEVAMEAFQAAQAKLSPEVAALRDRAGMIPPLMIYVEK